MKQIIIGSAIFIALADMRAVRRQTREEARALLEKTLRDGGEKVEEKEAAPARCLMDKRHRRGLSKQAVSDSCFSSVVLICFLVFDSELKRAGGRASSPSSRPPAVEKL